MSGRPARVMSLAEAIELFGTDPNALCYCGHVLVSHRVEPRDYACLSSYPRRCPCEQFTPTGETFR